MVRALLAWFRVNARDLPWRRHRNAYTAWLAEIMLQQTRVEQGLPYYERFLDAFPTVQDLASAPEDRVLKQWEGLGYYSRARNLHRAAQCIAFERDGAFPTTAADWMALPGIGRYTAGAIASMAFDEPVAVLDGNVIRVLARVFDIAECTDDAKTRDALWDIAESLVPKEEPGAFNESMMELGALVCLPRGPHCTECPLAKMCLAYAAGRPESRPIRRAAKAIPHRETVAVAIRKRGRYLIAKRPAKGLLGGLWEFPGGGVAQGESHAEALSRLLRDSLGIEIVPGPPIVRTNHTYSHFRETLYAYAARHAGGTPVPATYTEYRWVTPEQCADHAFPKVQHALVAAVLAGEKR